MNSISGRQNENKDKYSSKQKQIFNRRKRFSYNSRVEKRPDPKDLSTFSQCTEFPPHGNSNSRPPDLKLGAVTTVNTVAS
jgi:hypothetical protein